MSKTGTDAYDPRKFPPFAVTVDIAVFTLVDGALHVLLVERGEDPYLGAWALPGGFVKPDEDLKQAAARELEEETGVKVKDDYPHLEQLRGYGSPDRDPRMRVVTVAHWAACRKIKRLRGGGDVTSANLKPVSEVEDGAFPLAFDHAEIFRDALERFRSRLEFTTVGSRLCPPEFTVSQLRQVYEAAWNRKLDPGNFQRNVRMCGRFERLKAGRATHGKQGGRPASLWRVRPEAGQPWMAIAKRRGPNSRFLR